MIHENWDYVDSVTETDIVTKTFPFPGRYMKDDVSWTPWQLKTSGQVKSTTSNCHFWFSTLVLFNRKDFEDLEEEESIDGKNLEATSQEQQFRYIKGEKGGCT